MLPALGKSRTSYWLAAALVSLTLAACGGGGSGYSAPPTGGGGGGSTPTPAPTRSPSPNPTHTPSPSPSPTPTPSPTASGGQVIVTPASIEFTQNGPADYKVTVSGGSGTYVVGQETCTSQGNAEYEQLPSQPNVWDVSYGVNIGKCFIQFVDAFSSGNFTFLQVDNEHNPH
jgi:hypothetical protein